MYNTINPINIVYRKPQPALKKQEAVEADVQEKTPDVLDDKKQETRHFPHGAPVAIDYSKNKINISQVITDFKSTIMAINAPQDVSDEVNAYLSLVEKESLKEKPSREIIVSNLKNASKVSDAYIANALNKPSKVVEEWVDALFLQNVVLKADPKHVNEDFKVQLPEAADSTASSTASSSDSELLAVSAEPSGASNSQLVSPEATAREEVLKIETAQIREVPTSPATEEFISIFKNAKKLSKENNPKEALVAFASALEAAQKTGNVDFQGAAHLERGKIFDKYDHVSFALSEYNEATKCNDDNIKTHAHLKMAKIYDDYVKFEPALEHYHNAISVSVHNPAGQGIALKGIGKMYTERYDKTNAETFNSLALDTVEETNNPKLIGKTYREVANDLSYLGENKRALNLLKKSTETFSSLDRNSKETNAQIAQNYYDAAKLMKSLGNEAKANSLLSKAHQYQSLA